MGFFMKGNDNLKYEAPSLQFFQILFVKAEQDFVNKMCVVKAFIIV